MVFNDQQNSEMTTEEKIAVISNLKKNLEENFVQLGQVLVYHDILGTADFVPKFVKQYAALNEEIPIKLKEYCSDVRREVFPQEEHIYVPMKLINK